MRELFIYYRVRPDSLAQARRIVEHMHDDLRHRHPSLVARLLTRGDADTPTWMETYAAPPTGIDASVERAISAAAAPLLPLLAGERHVEAFDAAH